MKDGLWSLFFVMPFHFLVWDGLLSLNLFLGNDHNATKWTGSTTQRWRENKNDGLGRSSSIEAGARSPWTEKREAG